MTDKLFSSYQLTPQITLGHRIIFGPCTRSRAMPKTFVPALPLSAIYYEQRASVPGTLIVSEGTCISEQGRGCVLTPGVYTEEQIKAWSEITKRVHEKKSFIFMQLWHVGRCSLAQFQPGGKLPVTSTGGPPISSKVRGDKGREQCSPSRTLTLEEIDKIKEDYVQAAKNAIEAGCDGVEIHGANGYLLDQFLHDGVNKRTDKYGGSVENRARLHLEIVDAIVKAVGNERVGLRLSPYTRINDISDSNYDALYQYLLPELSKRKLVYVHFNEAALDMTKPIVAGGQIPNMSCTKLRKFYDGTLITCGNQDRESAVKIVDEGYADLIGFGRKFIANPDLPKRIRLNAPLNEPDVETFYGGMYNGPPEKGYTDYPFLE